MAGIELGEVSVLLERIRPVVSPEDYLRLAGLVGMLIELTKLVRAKGATIARLRRLLGHSSTEKTAAVCGEGPGAAGPPHSSSGPPTGAAVGDGARPKPKRKGHGRRAARDYEAHHIGVPHDTLHAGDCCPGCARGRLFRLLDPAQILRLFGQAPLFAICWDCERLRCGACGQVFTAPPPAEARGSKYSESAAGMLAVLRYGTGLPLNRLGHLQESLGVPVPASTQWEAVLERVATLVPVHEELVRCAADGSVLHNDDTSMRILEFMGRRRAKLLADGRLPDPDRTGLFTTAIIAVTGSGLIALFSTGRQHAGENLREVLQKRSGHLGPPIQMCDALDRNRPEGQVTLESNCLAHGRRHVVDEVENFPEECRHVLDQLGLVFRNEALCKEKGWSGEERLRFHQEQSGPVTDSLQAWMNEQISQKRIEPNSGLGQAFHYLLRRWDKLTLFLRIPDAPLENNICERAMKMAIRHRRNSLFYRSLNGARVGDVYMTLIHTARLHGENPFAYLTALFAHEASVAGRPADWLPWNYRATLAGLQRAAAGAA